MTNEELQELVRKQAEVIAQQSEQIAAIHSRLGPVEEAPLAAGAYREFPRVLYRVGTKGHKHGQVDHPGNDVMTVTSQLELDAAIADGWSMDPHPFVYEPEEPAKKPVGKK